METFFNHMKKTLNRSQEKACCAMINRASNSLLSMALATTVATSSAGLARAEDAPPVSRVNAIVNFEFANEYLTPRGMIVHDKGLTFQNLVLGLVNVYKGDDSFINDVTLVPGVWNDFSSSGVSVHAPFGSKPKTSWVEIDPIAGIQVKFAKYFTISSTYTAFNMQILDIGTSHHLENKLAIDDTEWLKAFALHPYVTYWQELQGKATAAQVPYFVNPLGKAAMPIPEESHYLEFGIAPSYTYEPWNLKFEAPMRVLLPDSEFYGEYYDPSSSLGLYEVGLKATIPLTFMPKGYGNWNVHAGFKFMGLEDDNLAKMQAFNAPGKETRDTVQYFFGIGAFF